MVDEDYLGVLDTNIVVRMVVSQPPDQAIAVTRFLHEGASSRQTLLLLSATVLEAAFVLGKYYDISREEQARAYFSILNLSYVHAVERAILLDAFLIYRSSADTSLVDAYQCAVARAGCQGNVISFDQNISNVDGITRIDPGSTPA